MKRNPLTLAIGILLILIFGLLLFVFQVRQSEVAVVTTFGKPTRDITAPGPYLKWPWPIQRVHKFDQRVQNFEDKLTEGLTSDSFNLLTTVYVGWRITEPKLFFPRFTGSSQPIAEAERVLEQRLSNIKTAVVSKHPLADFIAATNSSVNIATIEEEMLTAVRSQVQANNWGVEIDFLGIKKLQLPEGVTSSVFERMQSDRNALAARSQFEGEAEAQKIRSEADTKAAELLANAEGQATQIRAKGEAEAAKILPIFQKNPDLAVFLLRLNALESSLRERAILIFDQHTPPFDLFRGVSTNLLSK
jgi:membrane protease subunit HflC